jgi:phosphatidylglycerophosphatase A
VLLLGFVIGWWACTTTAQHARLDDPGAIVWDEVLAIWAILWVLGPVGFWGQAGAFALFRYFDAAKPGPVRWADRRFKGGGWRGGFGILFDDLVAAFCTLFTIALGVALWRALS